MENITAHKYTYRDRHDNLVEDPHFAFTKSCKEHVLFPTAPKINPCTTSFISR